MPIIVNKNVKKFIVSHRFRKIPLRALIQFFIYHSLSPPPINLIYVLSHDTTDLSVMIIIKKN